jgi:hypothetical protein
MQSTFPICVKCRLRARPLRTVRMSRANVFPAKTKPQKSFRRADILRRSACFSGFDAV